MSNIVEELTEALRIAKKIGDDIPEGIRQLTKTFIDLVEQGELISFGFDSTIHRNRITVTTKDKYHGLQESNPSLVIHMRVKGNLDLMLGTIGDPIERKSLEQSNFGGDQISEFTRKAIADAHDYLCFINNYASKNIPAIENHTRYSRDSFKPNMPYTTTPLVPSFCEDLITEELRNKYNNTKEYRERLKMK